MTKRFSTILLFAFLASSLGCAAGEVTLDSVLAKLADASGGKAALEKIKTRTLKMQLEAEGLGAGSTAEAFAKAPQFMATRVDLAGLGTIEEGCDGKVAWSKSSFAEFRLKTGDELAKAKRDAVLLAPLKMKEVYPGLALAGTNQVNGEPTHVLQSKPTATSTEKFFISTKTGLVVRQESSFQSDQGAVKTTVDMSDYRPVDDIKIPHTLKMVIAAPGQDTEVKIKVTQVKHNIEIPDSRFAKPPA